MISSEIISKVGDRLAVRMSIVYTKSTTDIDMFYDDLACVKLFMQIVYAITQSYKVSHIQNL